ncbi:hypothetical protein FOA52_007007 [Chlamydomonas sp. UWO 241]|nr:hypothetical protein FOA52_007007 [Chlamydomonas sp. UWO 241]
MAPPTEKKKKPRVEPLFPSTPEWDASVKKHRAVVKAEDPNSYEIFRFLSEHGRSMLKGLGLRKQERFWLQRCVTVTSASVKWVDNGDVDGFEASARIWAVDGSGFVDVMHEYCHLESRRHVHSASVSFSINGGSKTVAWTVQDTGTKHCVRESTVFMLKNSLIHAIRMALFPHDDHDKLNAWLYDYNLMSWILASVGYGDPYFEFCGEKIRHCHDGKVGVLLRRLCNADGDEDAEWEAADWDAEDEDDEGEDGGWDGLSDDALLDVGFQEAPVSRKRDGVTETPPAEVEKKKPRVEPLFPSTPEWDASVKKYRAVVKAEDPNSYEIFRLLGEHGRSMLKGLGLRKQERFWLQRCITVTSASVKWVDNGDVDGFEASARIWAVDGSGFVDVMHKYSHLECRRHVHSARVSFSINGGIKMVAWTVQDTGTKHCVRESTVFTLKNSHIDAIRVALFPQDDHDKLNAWLYDYDLMSWILAAVGYGDPYF